MINDLTSIILTAVLLTNVATAKPIVNSTTKVVAEKQFSLNDRYSVASVNEIMKKNILLNLAYMAGAVTKKSDIDWNKVTSAFHYERTLNPGEVFAYHMNVQKRYADKLAFTTNSHFNSTEGYLSDGYLYGDGVCHLASLLNWAAQGAGLKTYVPKDHRSVAHIPEIPDDYGVSIYINMADGVGANNNLYITNTKDSPVIFNFDYDGTNLKISITRA